MKITIMLNEEKETLSAISDYLFLKSLNSVSFNDIVLDELLHHISKQIRLQIGTVEGFSQ